EVRQQLARIETHGLDPTEGREEVITTGTEVANRASVPDQECAFVRCDVQLHGDLLSLGLGWKRCVPAARGCRAPWTAAGPRQRAARHRSESADPRSLRARGTRHD